MLLLPRLLILLLVAMSQPLLAAETSCVKPATKDSRTSGRCAKEGDNDKPPAADRTGFDLFESAFGMPDECDVEYQSTGIGRTPGFCEQLV